MSTRQDRVRSIAAAARVVAANNHYSSAWMVEHLAQLLVELMDDIDHRWAAEKSLHDVWPDDRWVPRDDDVDACAAIKTAREEVPHE